MHENLLTSPGYVGYQHNKNQHIGSVMVLNSIIMKYSYTK